MNSVATRVDTMVKGSPSFTKSKKVTLCPRFFSIPTATTFAAAPKGVIFPPMDAPMTIPKQSRYGSMPRLFERIIPTGSIAVTYGTLSIKAERKTETQTRIRKANSLFGPVIAKTRCAILSMIPLSVNIPTRMNIAKRKKSVSQSNLMSNPNRLSVPLWKDSYQIIAMRPKETETIPPKTLKSRPKMEILIRPNVINIRSREGIQVLTSLYSDVLVFCVNFLKARKRMKRDAAAPN